MYLGVYIKYYDEAKNDLDIINLNNQLKNKADNDYINTKVNNEDSESSSENNIYYYNDNLLE